ncbi:response regulator [Telmatospirillum siberiense]|uniref:Response regulatory domain-containing protein n=1 Tax=Telmatospirillum siberiense TaxID=382514 RepID=A0A2N3PTQ8_9PROT|nr:response regulator [Telmatospirillum siberiense]PKU23785.1 hypothetical protein CWS72_14955 [Telmatospirillum siberiense]
MSLILVIEDEWELRSGLATGLRHAGFDVSEAEDGDTGYDAILSLRPDLVLCDIGLPGLRGDKVLERLRRERPDLSRLPFLFLTAFADRQSILAGHQLGADDYLVKPIDLELLVAVIAKRLEQVERWEISRRSDLERQRDQFLSALSERSQLSFLSAADVLHHLSDAVLLFNEARQVIFINRVARRLLAQEDGLSLRNGVLTGTRGEDSRRIQALLSAVLSPVDGVEPRPLVLPRPSGRRAYEARACRLDAGLDLGPDCAALAALFLSDPEFRCRPSEAALCALYGFTRTEARIVANLTLGLSVGEVAHAQRISRNTVHHHLKSIFVKTDTTRQSELVALVLSGLAARSAVPAALADRS